MSSPDPTPLNKKMKIEIKNLPAAGSDQPITCKHFVIRKKRYCKLTVAKGKEYCGQHIPTVSVSSHEDSYISEDKKAKRIACPLDNKHTVFLWNLEKHLKICNAKTPTDEPDFISRGINKGEDDSDHTIDPDASMKLSEVDPNVLHGLIDKLNRIYETHIDQNIDELYLEHESMEPEIAKDIYGPETLKHLRQTSSILGYLRDLDFLGDSTSFVEFGAGKGHLSFWLAQVIKQQKRSNVILVDRASHRHKQDNKVEERDVVYRIRADIADLDLRQLKECRSSQHLVGVSKHLCGAATDLAIRCLLNDGSPANSTETVNNGGVRTKGLVIALCCHHRCEWRSFVGKEFLQENGIGRDEFGIMTKMVSWAVCGSGMSRETRKAIEEQKNGATNPTVENPVHQSATSTLTRAEKEVIGKRCKRVLDYARVTFLRSHGFESRLNYYVPSEITLENTCLIGYRSK